RAILTLNVPWSLKCDGRLVGCGLGSASQYRFVGHGLVRVASNRGVQSRLVQFDVGGHGQPYPAVVSLAIQREADAEVAVLDVPAPIAAGISRGAALSCLDEIGVIIEEGIGRTDFSAARQGQRLCVISVRSNHDRTAAVCSPHP